MFIVNSCITKAFCDHIRHVNEECNVGLDVSRANIRTYLIISAKKVEIFWHLPNLVTELIWTLGLSAAFRNPPPLLNHRNNSSWLPTFTMPPEEMKSSGEAGSALSFYNRFKREEACQCLAHQRTECLADGRFKHCVLRLRGFPTRISSLKNEYL